MAVASGYVLQFRIIRGWNGFEESAGRFLLADVDWSRGTSAGGEHQAMTSLPFPPVQPDAFSPSDDWSCYEIAKTAKKNFFSSLSYLVMRIQK